MKKISKILIENAMARDEIRSIKGGSGFSGCRFDWDCPNVMDRCCYPTGWNKPARGTCSSSMC